MRQYKKYLILFAFAFIISGFKLDEGVHLKPLPVSLKVVPPLNWKFKAPDGAAIQSLVPPGFQGHIEPVQKTDLESSIYEINVFAFERNSKLPASAQIEAAFHAVFPNDKIPKAKISEVKNNGADDGVDRTIEVPYASSAVTTVLHARAGKKTIVVIETVVRGHEVENPALESVLKMMPEVVYSLNEQ